MQRPWQRGTSRTSPTSDWISSIRSKLHPDLPMPLRLIFMGTPDFAVPTLGAIAAASPANAAVYTRVPKPAGRGMALQPSPVEREAQRLGLPILTPATLRSAAAQAEFRAFK